MDKQQALEKIEELKKFVADIDSKKEEKVIGLEIKNRFTGDIIFTSTKTTYKEAVEEAVKGEADLSYADLSYADLSDANLSKANLNYANLSYADLSYAKISGCLFYMGNGHRNFEALCKAIKTLKHQDGSADTWIK